jgi:hypothetical protein
MQKTSEHLTDSCTVAVKRASHCARESLLEIVKALRLLQEAHAGVRHLQPQRRSLEP